VHVQIDIGLGHLGRMFTIIGRYHSDSHVMNCILHFKAYISV